jgi:hypothetical protein
MTDRFVPMTWAEILLGGQAGVMRQTGNLKDNRKPRYGADNKMDWQKHIEGCLGEMAFAKWRNRYWSGQHGNLSADDVAQDQVRTGFGPDMLMHPHDHDDKRYWFLKGINGKYEVMGWLWGRDCKQDKWWRDPRPGRFCFCVPVSALRDPDDNDD